MPPRAFWFLGDQVLFYPLCTPLVITPPCPRDHWLYQPLGSFDAARGASTSSLWPLGQHQNSLWPDKANDPSGRECNNLPSGDVSQNQMKDFLTERQRSVMTRGHDYWKFRNFFGTICTSLISTLYAVYISGNWQGLDCVLSGAIRALTDERALSGR